MENRYVFDLDNTIIMTNKLNNESYNYALSHFGLPPLALDTRITRKIVNINYPNLTGLQKIELISLKQSYFKSNISYTVPNLKLISLLQSKEQSCCLLWTSADKERAECLLKYYEIQNSFISILYSDKKRVETDINKICKIFDCNKQNLRFFEDDIDVIYNLRLLGQNVTIIDSDLSDDEEGY